jgi:F0F1-type ATP synthase membrane subunit b/b'
MTERPAHIEDARWAAKRDRGELWTALYEVERQAEEAEQPEDDNSAA